MYEVEVKAHLRNREEVIEKLKSMGCVFSEELHQVDEIFTVDSTEFPPPMGSPVLRIRNQNGKYIFTLKVNQSSRQDCIEHELEIDNADQMRSIVKLLGYKEDVIVDKKRIKTKYKDMEIVLDTVERLGEFVEAEKVVNEADPNVRIKIQDELMDFLGEIGVTRADQVIDGKYDIMLFEKIQAEK